MAERNIASLRGTLSLLEDKGELLKVRPPVSPILEIAGIEKALENGPALLFENIEGYPGVRLKSAVFPIKAPR